MIASQHSAAPLSRNANSWSETDANGLPTAIIPEAEEQLSWLQALSHLHPKYGGLSAVVPQLSEAISATSRYSINLAGFCESGEAYLPETNDSVIVTHLPFSRRDWRRQVEPFHKLQTLVAEAAGVHIHGLWQHSTSLCAALARRSGKPYIISAHGMLEAWALANKRWKKEIYLALVERKNLQGAACLHALTRAELQDYRRLGLRNPVAIIPNGVHIPEHHCNALFEAQFPALAGKRLVLFLGRIHFKKGLDILTEAWARVAPQWPDAHLVLAGPDFENTRSSIEDLIRRTNLQDRVTFTGMLTGNSKWSALAAAELFVLPSYSEGLSVSVLEAMGVAKPVLITENCNLPEVSEAGCGVVIAAKSGELADALHTLLHKSPSSLAAMGSRGKTLVRARYSWSAVGKQMASLYDWIGGGPLPAHVELDVLGASR